MSLKQTYFDWNRALIPQVKEALLSEAQRCESVNNQEQAIDLSHLLVIVPTAKSGRHLLEALSTDTQTLNKGLLSPEIITPIQFIDRAVGSKNCASEADCLFAWMRALNRYPEEKLRTIFPITPPSEVSRLDQAQRLHRLRQEIGIEGIDLSSIAKACAEETVEPWRWSTLAELESDYYQVLNETGLIDPMQAKQACAENYPKSIRFSKIIIVATPDPKPLALKAFKLLEKIHTIEVWINGPEGDLFDSWGIPNPKHWENRALDMNNWNYQIHRLNQSLDIPEAIVRKIANQPVESLQIGLLDPNLIQPVSHYFSTASLPFYNPEGLPMSDSALGKFILSLLYFQEDQSIDRLKQLLLNPYFHKSAPVNQSIEDLLTAIDTLFDAHLCHNLVDLKTRIRTPAYSKMAELSSLIDYAESFIYRKHIQQGFVEWLKENLNRLLNQVGLLEIDSAFKNLIEAISQTFEEALSAEKNFRIEASKCGQTVLAELLKKQKIYKEREKDAHDLFGWLELLWHDAPHSILCGLNEGIVPRAPSNDAFLTEHLKNLLGMQTQEQSYANDLYLFEAIGRKRSLQKGGIRGKLSIYLPESDAEGNPLMPSRLLFQVPDSQLLETTESILLKKANRIKFNEHRPAWIINSALPAARPDSISVSALKDYLLCPFRFYLKHILKLRSKNYNQREMSAAEFGILFHGVVACLEGETFQPESDEIAWIDRLHRTADRKIASQYGNNLSFALKMQKESIRDRLTAFIRSQLNHLKESRQSLSITQTEKQFELPLGSFTLRGTIDRIDSDTDGIHIIDYKTSNSEKTPQAIHLKSAHTQQEPKHLPPAAYLSLGNKDYYWADLQLPLYALAQIEETQSAELPRLSYYSVPKSAEKTRLANWVNFDQSILDSAKSCALAVLKNIEEGKFWPPNEHIDPMHDPFAHLFPDGIQKAVDARAFNPFTYNNDAV